MMSSVEQQLKYQHDVPFVDITVELICMWFDEAYLIEYEEFMLGFSKKEMKSMSDFSKVFEDVIASFPDRELPGITNLVEMPQWKRVVESAQNALNVFEHRKTD